MKTLRIAAITALALAPLGLAGTAHAADDATVSVLHGVPGATVDVYANGKALLTDFKPGTLTDPLKLPEGTYDLKVTAAGAGASGAAVIQACTGSSMSRSSRKRTSRLVRIPASRSSSTTGTPEI